MLLAVTLGDMAFFFLKLALIFAGLYLIIILTPKLAAFIDKKRAQNKSPYESAPDPARVDDDASVTENDASEPAESTTDSKNEE